MSGVFPQQIVDGDLTLADVARVRRCSTDTVRRRHAEWTETLGFPAAVSLPGVRGPRWSRAAVAVWELQRAAAFPGAGAGAQAATDWHAVAAARGALLDLGLDPDAVALHSASVPTLAASD